MTLADMVFEMAKRLADPETARFSQADGMILALAAGNLDRLAALEGKPVVVVVEDDNND